MEFNEYEKLKNIEYSPKQALAYFVMSKDNVMENNLNNIIISLINIMLQNRNNLNILDNLNDQSLEKIINYWGLTSDQVIAYGIIVFYNLIRFNSKLSEENIADRFSYDMRFFTPEGVVRFVNRKIKMNEF